MVILRWELSHLFELRIALDEFFRTAAGKTHGNFAIVFIALDGHNCAQPEFGMPDFSTEERIGISAALDGRSAKRRGAPFVPGYRESC